MAEKKEAGKRLLQFYGTECVHCHEMMPLVEQLEKEFKVKVHKLEVWNNDDNAELLAKTDKGSCGGIPFFFNEVTGARICGSTSYDKLKKWAVGEK